MEREKILEVKSLKQHFKVGSGSKKMVVKAIDDISFDIYKGEVFGLVGESGCGKTTTGRTIIKLYDATDGEILYKGKRIGGGIDTYLENIERAKLEAQTKISKLSPTKKDNQEVLENAEVALAHLDADVDNDSKVASEQVEQVANLATTNLNTDGVGESNSAKIKQIKQELKQYVKEQRALIKQMKEDNAFKGELINEMKNIQMIFQDPISSLNPRMTVKEIIAEGLRIAGVKDENLINEKVFEILKIVGLVPEHAFRYPHEFSGGQRQRIGIARALIVTPELLIADEPISALDVSIQAQVINLLKDLQETLNLTILFIAHDLSVVKYFSDRIGVMYFGKMVELAPAEELFNNPLHPYTKSLLSAIPIPDPQIERKRVRFSYDPTLHNYTETNQPSFKEVKAGHFVYGSKSEIAEYKKQVK